MVGKYLLILANLSKTHSTDKHMINYKNKTIIIRQTPPIKSELSFGKFLKKRI